MSKELEALNWVRQYEYVNPELKVKLDIIETALKVLEMIEDRGVDVSLLNISKNKDEYFEFIFKRLENEKHKNYLGYKLLSQDEFDLLKDESR